MSDHHAEEEKWRADIASVQQQLAEKEARLTSLQTESEQHVAQLQSEHGHELHECRVKHEAEIAQMAEAATLTQAAHQKSLEEAATATEAAEQRCSTLEQSESSVRAELTAMMAASEQQSERLTELEDKLAESTRQAANVKTSLCQSRGGACLIIMLRKRSGGPTLRACSNSWRRKRPG